METESITRPKRMPLSEIVTTAEFQILTARQQQFVRHYVESVVNTGTYDAIAAVKAAYNATDKSAVVMAYELTGQRLIKKVLDLHFGRTEFDSVLTDLGQAIRKALRKDAKTGGLSIATTKALEFYERHSQKSEKSQPTAEQEDTTAPERETESSFVGEIRRQKGYLFKVTGVDSEGQITAAEPLDKQ